MDYSVRLAIQNAEKRLEDLLKRPESWSRNQEILYVRMDLEALHKQLKTF
jgi:hypothetical protein